MPSGRPGSDGSSNARSTTDARSQRSKRWRNRDVFAYVGDGVVVDVIVDMHISAAAAVASDAFDAVDAADAKGVDGKDRVRRASGGSGDGAQRVPVTVALAVAANYVPAVCRKWRAAAERAVELQSCLEAHSRLALYVAEKREMLQRIHDELGQLHRKKSAKDADRERRRADEASLVAAGM